MTNYSYQYFKLAVMLTKIIVISLNFYFHFQAKLARKADADDTYQDHGPESSDTTSEKEFQMYITNTGDTLSVNLENVSNSLQKEIIDKLGLFLTSKSDLEKVRNFKFNSVSEDVYRLLMYMPFRKLGYDCMFTRYNDDKGLASFTLEDAERKVKRNYYRSGLPNKC